MDTPVHSGTNEKESSMSSKNVDEMISSSSSSSGSSSSACFSGPISQGAPWSSSMGSSSVGMEFLAKGAQDTPIVRTPTAMESQNEEESTLLGKLFNLSVEV